MENNHPTRFGIKKGGNCINLIIPESEIRKDFTDSIKKFKKISKKNPDLLLILLGMKRCPRCDHKWKPRKHPPKQCPKCKYRPKKNMKNDQAKD